MERAYQYPALDVNLCNSLESRTIRMWLNAKNYETNQKLGAFSPGQAIPSSCCDPSRDGWSSACVCSWIVTTCSSSEKGEGNKMKRESCWKSGGGRVRLYTWRRVGLADEVGSDAIPDAAGGEGGHGAARPDGVIHRYVFNQIVTPARGRGSKQL
jgi:hypothetical protein